MSLAGTHNGKHELGEDHLKHHLCPPPWQYSVCFHFLITGSGVLATNKIIVLFMQFVTLAEKIDILSFINIISFKPELRVIHDI